MNSSPTTSSPERKGINKKNLTLQMKTKLIYILTVLSTSLFAQVDTVTIKVGEGSKVIFAIKDKKDLETMKRYDFQKLMDEMIYKLQMRDSSQLKKMSSEFLKKDTINET